MENEERLKKLEAGKAKLAEYRQRKAYVDSQKKQQKKKKKKKSADDSEVDSQGRADVEPDRPEGEEEVLGEGRDGSEEEKTRKDPCTTEFTFAKTLRSGETVKHDQTYTIEPESEVSTTADDYSSEVNGCHEMTENLMRSSKDFVWEEAESIPQETKGGTTQDMEEALAAKSQAVDELKQELEDIRAAFGTEGIQQLQDFEAALKQRDGIITQLTANLQEAREEKDEIMKEFLELTEQSQKLHIQFQQLQAGETLRNTNHSSTAADLLQARQQLIQYQQQLEEMNVEARRYQEGSSEQRGQISQLQQQISKMEMSGRSSDDSYTQRANEKDLLIAEQERIILSHEQSLIQLRETEESYAHTLREKNLLISEQTTIITKHEGSLTLLREECAQAGRTAEETSINESNEKDLIIAEQERVISERDCLVTKIKNDLESSARSLHDLQEQVAAKESELERCLDEWESTKSVLQSCKGEMESCKLELDKERTELENCKSELSNSRQKERMSSAEIMQLMGTVEDLQKRCHQGSLSEGDALQRMEEESVRKLALLRAELDEMYGQQIVQMKQELNLQHVANVDQMIQQHLADMELLKAQHQSQISAVRMDEVDTLDAKVRELQETLSESQAMQSKVRHELSQVTQEKLNLQAKVDHLLQDLHSAKEEVELVSRTLMSQESKHTELHHLQDTIDTLQCQLAAAEEDAQEAEAKHESETTNYKIKLEMLEREKDAVLGRMAESQEAELERLRTQLLFSHEEELTNLKEELQRENFLNTENLLNEAAIKHKKALDELSVRYEQELRSEQGDKAGVVTERDELLHQILALKEELKMTLQSSKGDELVGQLQELQVEVEELRKGGEERARMEKELQTLLIKTEELEKQAQEKEECWANKVKNKEVENNMLIESNNALKEETESTSRKIETLTADNIKIQQQVEELSVEMERQRTSSSFAEKNFEETYQELKKDYKCLIKAKTQLEERTLKETLEFEAKISSLQSQIQRQEESSRGREMEDAGSKAAMEKDTTELMEKLTVTLKEKESLAGRLSEVTEKLTVTESKVGQLDEELTKARQENKTAIAQNKSLKKELEKKKETVKPQTRGKEGKERKAKVQQGEKTPEPAASVVSSEDHHLRIQSLQGEVEALQSRLQAAEAERDGIRQTLEVQRLTQTPAPSPAAAAAAAAAPSPAEEPVEGRSSLQKPTASASSKRKRRQRSKQERKPGIVPSQSREERGREEEEEETAVEEEKAATSVAERELPAQMESQVTSQHRADTQDSTDGCQGNGDRDHINKRVRANGTRRHMEPVVQPGAEEEQETPEHGDCRLQMEAQRISLSQIHAAQLELLQEHTDTHTHSLELKLQHLKEHHGQDEPRIFKYKNMLQAVSEECSEIISSFRKIFGENVLESIETKPQQPPSVEVQRPPTVEVQGSPSEERPETSECPSVLLEARALYKDLQLVKDGIEQEHERLSQLQILLRADGNKMMELQMAYDELKRNSEEISELRMQGVGLGSAKSKDPEEHAGVPSTSQCEDLQRLKAEAQEKQLQLEESHRQQMEHLRAHYQQQAEETEERYTTELLMLEHRLQEATGTHAHFSLSSVPESSSERVEEHRGELKHDLVKEGPSERSAEPHWSTRSVGLTAQLQALRKALYHKYIQEVTALKAQHSTEPRRVREDGEQVRKTEEGQEVVLPKLEQDLRGDIASGLSAESIWAGEQAELEEKNWEKVEEEVAKAIVQMSVEFAQQTELARIIRHSSQTTTSMQTQLDEGKVEKREKEALTVIASVSTGSFLEEVVRETLEKELEERNTEIRKLKEQLQKSKSAPEQALQKTQEGPEVEDDEDWSRVDKKKAGGQTVSSQDEGESSEKDDVTSERNLLRKANERLCQVLGDVLKTTAAAEETMGLHMQSLCDSSSGEHRDGTGTIRPHAAGKSHQQQCYVASESTERYQGSRTRTDDVSMWSGEVAAAEGLEVSRQMMDSLLLGAGTRLENEEYVTGISSRLQAALEKMLMAITDTTNQLEHARLTQTELMRESFRHNQEMSELLQKQEELQERAMEEARAREQLALELHRAEGVIDGYTGERAVLEEQLRQKEELQLSLEQDLQVTSSRLHELEQERLQMQEERELLSRQQDAMREHAGPRELRLVEAAMVAAPEADLLEETEKLMKEKVEVQRQAEKENSDLFKQVKLLEAELEEQVNRVIELEQAQRTESGDLQQQIQALEKQLDKNRRFLDEQAVDREHERDFFQQEIHKLEQELKNPQKLQAGSEKRIKQVDQLTSQLKEKADWCSELLLSSEQLRRELGERDEEIDKLESRIRELEQALLASAESLEKTEEKKQDEAVPETQHSTLEAQLQTEREALDRKEKEICNLEEQLEQFREELENKSEEVQQLQMQLEIQKKELSSQQQYLETRDSMLQVMEEKDRQIALLNEQISKLQHTETASDNKEIDERDEVIKELESRVECMRSEQERLKRNNEEEIDQLNSVVDRLQEELTNIAPKPTTEEDEEAKCEPDSREWGPSKEEYDEMKQRMNLATKELDVLQKEHSKLSETYSLLRDGAEAVAETGKLESSDGELKEALREKTAGLVVMQAQVQALEQSASSKVDELSHRIQELEALLGEKDSELASCRPLLEQTQSFADGLQQKVSKLEDNLREKVAAALVSQATLEAFQQQSQGSKEEQGWQKQGRETQGRDTQGRDTQGLEKQVQEKQGRETQSLETQGWETQGRETQGRETQGLETQGRETQGLETQTEPQVYAISDFGFPQIDFSGMVQARQVSPGKVVHLTQKLRELEVGLSGMQKDQELQKQLLSSSEEEVLEYEKRLAVLMDLLSQMTTNTRVHQRTPLSAELPSDDDQPAVSVLQKELEEVREEASVTKEQLSNYKESCGRLEEALKEKTATIERLRDQLQTASAGGSEETAVSELQHQLKKAQNETASNKEELNSSRESCEKLQDLLQEREMTIAYLKGELAQVTAEVEDGDVKELLQELQEVRNDVSSTKEELGSYKQRCEKLEDEIQIRELSISKFKEELEKVRADMDTTQEEVKHYRENSEKLEGELQIRELSISKLNEELQEVRSDMDTTKEELGSDRWKSEKLAEELDTRELTISKLNQELQEVNKDMENTKEELSNYREKNEKLRDDLQVRELSISKFKEELEKVRADMDTTQEEVNRYRENSEKLEGELQIRELSISKLNKELQEVRSDMDTTKEELGSAKLNEELQEVTKDMENTKEELSNYKENNEKLRNDLQVRDLSISKLKAELQEVKKAVDTTKEEVNSYRQRFEKLEGELQVRELSMSKLKEELQVTRTTAVKTADSASRSPAPSPSPQPVSSASSSSNSAAQPKRKGGKQPAGRGGSAKDKSSLSRKNSSQSSDKSRPPVLQSDFGQQQQQQRVALTDSFTQTEALKMPDPGVHSKSALAATKEEVEEVIGEFQEKIVQMQELHAAEILDMEARHITESETLRRDTQALDNECKALKTVIDKLRSAEPPAARPEHLSRQFKDGYISDSGSDYSQRTGYDLPSLQQEFRTTPEGARRETDDPLPDKIKTLLREVHQEGMQVLSLSELPDSGGEPGGQFHVPGWAKEREALLANVESLKNLISQMQIHRETQTSGTGDWRGALLDAVRLVFVKERSVLKSALYSQLEVMDTSDAIVHLNQLEHRLAEQDAQHREAMGTLYTADRANLITEVHHLRNQLEQLSQGVQPAVSLVSLRQQREGGGADGAAEADGLLVEELKGELSQTKLELETTLKAQHKHLREMETLRAEVSQKAAEMDRVNDQLSEERKRSRDLQWAMEKEKCRTGRNEETKQEELEDLRLSLEDEQSRVAELTSALEQERQASSELVQQTEQERLSLQRRLQELQVQLDTERAKTLEMSSALERQRELRTGVCTDSGPSNEDEAGEDGSRLEEEEGSLVERLQRELDDKYTQVVHLLSQVEAQKLEVVRKEEELTLATQRSRRDEEALLEARAQLQSLGERAEEAQEQLEREVEQRRRLEGEKERLEERLTQRGGQGGGERAGSGDGQSPAPWHAESPDRTKDWVFQQKSGNAQVVGTSTPAGQEVTGSGHTGAPHHGPWHAIDKILGKLHLISSKICAMASKTPSRLMTEVDTEELSWVQSNMNEVITMLQQSPGHPSVPESLPLLAGSSSSSSNSLTERLLRQNAELTGFVSRLTEEKNDLRNHSLRLEEELRCSRQTRLSSGDSSGGRRGGVRSDSGLQLSQEREAWVRERVRLEKALNQAQAQVARLRGEIRTDTLRDVTGPDLDNAALKRIYGKYLRSESFRKALIYQKKYLLLLLGGFQECEEATLSLISRMGGRPPNSNMDSLSQRRRGLTRFRSAVRVSIALSRMRFLVKRWQKTTGMSSGISSVIIKNGAGQLKGTDMRDSPYLQPGSVEVYRERGGEGGGGLSSSRGRSGRESPRSAVSCPHHRFHLAGDASALTCSHMQNYDPDRALTDYISRLEALQRRLGSVTSGASSHAQLHFGLRR
ncbi:A-kinase anchor protein 9 [Genypterus blacodes]|uniref:A-kinase anchor protein 9 n=1 Tax=Genypterus blacodes TaxID=154954 RepID=UPI003F774295